VKIVVVDHVYLDEKHIKKLRSLGDLQIYEEPPKSEEELKTRIRNADVVIVGWSKLTKSVIDSARNLKMISIWATSCHYADVEAAKERGIVVTHVPGYATESVAEFTFALMLATMRKVVSADKHVREGRFDWRPFVGKELAGKTLGIIGTGAIGFRVAEIARAFKMQLLGYDKYPDLRRAEEAGLRYVDLTTLMKESDVITVHVALMKETEKLIGKREIASMKKGAVLINTSQGEVIDEKALTDALSRGKILCAGLDVFEKESPSKTNPLFKLDNAVLSPHIGFNTTEARARCSDICVGNVANFVRGKTQNLC
jgi:phosphoglycerate dehydrogenase-like enzyme